MNHLRTTLMETNISNISFSPTHFWRWYSFSQYVSCMEGMFQQQNQIFLPMPGNGATRCFARRNAWTKRCQRQGLIVRRVPLCREKRAIIIKEIKWQWEMQWDVMYVMRYVRSLWSYTIICSDFVCILCAVFAVLVTQLCMSFGSGQDRVGDLATSNHMEIHENSLKAPYIPASLSWQWSPVEICKTVSFPQKINLPISEFPQLLLLWRIAKNDPFLSAHSIECAKAAASSSAQHLAGS